MKYGDFYPSNHALRDLNKRQLRRSWRRKLRTFIRQISPRIRMARHDLEPWMTYGEVTPAPEPRPRNEFQLILQQRAFYEHEEAA